MMNNNNTVEHFDSPKPEILGDNDVIVEVANTPEDQIGRLGVVTQRYIREGYLQGIPFANIHLSPDTIVQENGYSILKDTLEEDLFEKFLETGMLFQFIDGHTFYLDKYHWQSVQFVAKTKEGYGGSTRIIQDNIDITPSFPLPILTDKCIEIEESWRPKINGIHSELSQFAKTKEAKGTVPVALLRAAAQYSRTHNIEKWLATTDNSVVRLLNGWIFNFNLPKIGPSVKYLGSESTPILIDIERSIKNASQKENSKDMARFLAGEDNVEGFEWYTGQ
jgi:hypothetical protein